MQLSRLLALLLACAAFAPPPSSAQAPKQNPAQAPKPGPAQAPAPPAELREPVEPAPEMVQSGQCRVPVCTDFDFGDHAFRVYAPERPQLLRFIPKGACQCATVRQGSFKDQLEID